MTLGWFCILYEYLRRWEIAAENGEVEGSAAAEAGPSWDLVYIYLLVEQ